MRRRPAEDPLLEEKFRLPPGNGTNEAFRTLARKMLEQGQAQRELLAKHGLDPLREPTITAEQIPRSARDEVVVRPGTLPPFRRSLLPPQRRPDSTEALIERAASGHPP